MATNQLSISDDAIRSDLSGKKFTSTKYLILSLPEMAGP